MSIKDLYYRKLPRARFWMWLEATFGLEKDTLKKDWGHLTPDERVRITEKLASRFSVKATHTKDDIDIDWQKAACVSISIIRFCTLGYPYGHALDGAKYKTSYGEYSHIESPMGLPCHLVNTSANGETINHMVNAMLVQEDMSKISSWAFFDGSGLMTPGKGQLQKVAQVFSNKPDVTTIYHGKILNKKPPYVAQFVL